MVYFLGLDISTTGSKALIADERGRVISAASSPHTLQRPRALWSEQDPQEWWWAGSASIRAVLEKAGIDGARIGAVGLTGQMHGLVLLDEVGEVYVLRSYGTINGLRVNVTKYLPGSEDIGSSRSPAMSR